MKVFVTGATGVVGSRAVLLMVRDGHEVTGAARSAAGAARLAEAGARPVSVDLFDRRGLQQAMGGQGVVVNLATHIPGSTLRMFLPGAWRENDRIRREGSACLAEAALAAGVGRLVQESFAPVYADAGDRWIDESAPITPLRYNRSVADAERAAALFNGRGGTAVVLRFANFYGPDALHVPDMINAVCRGWGPLPGAPRAWFSSVAHDDAATAVLAALLAPAGTYNVTDDEPLTRRAYVDMIASLLGVASPRLPPGWLVGLGGSLAAGMSRSQRISNRKLRDATGWAPRYPSAREGWRAVLEALRILPGGARQR